jgi:hypothetical protein
MKPDANALKAYHSLQISHLAFCTFYLATPPMQEPYKWGYPGQPGKHPLLFSQIESLGPSILHMTSCS